MRTSHLARLLAGLFVSLALATGAGAAPQNRKPTPTPEPLCRLYFTHPGGPTQPGGLIGSGLTSGELRACGFDAVLTSGDQALAYRWLTGSLTEEAVRESLAPIVQAADGMPVWLTVNATTQAGNPLPGDPARTFYDPHNAAHRARALANLETVARVAAVFGIDHLGIDFEAYGVGSWTYTYPTPQARKIGAELAQAARRGNPRVTLFGLCPLSFYAQTPGFRALARGWYGVAGASGLFLDEDTYGMWGDPVRSLRWAHTFTQARRVAAGWFASDRADAGAAWYYACAPKIRETVQYCPVLLVYREGPALWGNRPDLRDAAGAVLRGLAP